MSTIQVFFFIGIYLFYFISNNNCRLLTTIQVFDIMFDNSAPPSYKDMDVNIKNILIVYFPTYIRLNNSCVKNISKTFPKKE
jgi:hypothetical protein